MALEEADFSGMGAPPMDAFLTSTALVALAEIGDKTQLLALVLAARFRRPIPIVLGILVATLANHALAALVGASAAAWLEGAWFQIAVAIGFIAMGLWTLIPDKFDDDDAPRSHRGAFLTTLVSFFLVEIGDKTQIATIALGARYGDVVSVTAGTTLGMLLANAPVVLAGDALIKRVPLNAVRIAAALLFVAMGVWMLANALTA
jgi:Ca2+/H+ antiporter, TMEM165/GDT1 family